MKPDNPLNGTGKSAYNNYLRFEYPILQLYRKEIKQMNTQKTYFTLIAAWCLIMALIPVNIMAETSYTVPFQTITIDGNYDDWNGIEPVITDRTGEIYGGEGYDLSKGYIAYDDEYLYFRAECSNSILIDFSINFNFSDWHVSTDLTSQSLYIRNNYGIDIKTYYDNDFIRFTEKGVECKILLSHIENDVNNQPFDINIWNHNLQIGDSSNSTVLAAPSIIPHYREDLIHHTSFTIPDQTISVDGFVEDWATVPFLALDRTDEIYPPLDGYPDIEATFICKDSQYLYFRIDYKNELTPEFFQQTHNRFIFDDGSENSFEIGILSYNDVGGIATYYNCHHLISVEIKGYYEPGFAAWNGKHLEFKILLAHLEHNLNTSSIYAMSHLHWSSYIFDNTASIPLNAPDIAYTAREYPIPPEQFDIPVKTIIVDGSLADWNDVPLLCQDNINELYNMNLDLIKAYAAHDNDYLYFAVQFANSNTFSSYNSITFSHHDISLDLSYLMFNATMPQQATIPASGLISAEVQVSEWLPESGIWDQVIIYPQSAQFGFYTANDAEFKVQLTDEIRDLISAHSNESRFFIDYYSDSSQLSDGVESGIIKFSFAENPAPADDPILPVSVAVTADPLNGAAPLSVIFKAKASNAQGISLEYFWDFGDNSQGAIGQSVSHTFTSEGSFTVTLTATDNASGKTYTELSVITATASEPGPVPDDPEPDNTVTAIGKAMIIAGGGAHKSNTLFPFTENLCNSMYALLKQRGYADGDIIYFNPLSWQDIDGDGRDDNVVDEELFDPQAELEASFNDLALNIGNSGQFVFYIHSHARPDHIKITQGYELSAAQLETWLNMLPADIPQVIIIDTCYSGSMLDGLKGVPGRTVITSSDAESVSWNVKPAGFSDVFIRKLRLGTNVLDAFRAAERLIESDSGLFGSQTPQLDDNHDGIYSSADGPKSAGIFLGNEGVQASDPPHIILVHPLINLSLNEASAVLWVTTSPSGDAMKSVTATLVKPDFQPESYNGETTLFETETVELIYNAARDRFETVYDSFREYGSWKIMYQAKGNDGQTSDIAFGEVSAAGTDAAATVKAALNQSAYKAGDILRFDTILNGNATIDLYVAIGFPGGFFQSITHPLNFNMVNMLLPYKSDLPVSGEKTYSIIQSLELPDGLLSGEYTLYALIVQQGEDPWDGANWIHFDYQTFVMN